MVKPFLKFHLILGVSFLQGQSKHRNRKTADIGGLVARPLKQKKLRPEDKQFAISLLRDMWQEKQQRVDKYHQQIAGPLY